MSLFAPFKTASWWKAYAIYLVIIAPVLVLDAFVIPHGWPQWAFLIPLIVAAQCINKPLQRRWWP